MVSRQRIIGGEALISVIIKLVFGLLWNKISRLIKKGQERFLVIEQIDESLEATFAKINPKQKKITLLKRKKIKNLSQLKKPFFLLDKLILGLDSNHSTTIESVVCLKRSRPQEIINEAELDHLVFKGLWEFLNHYRSWTAKKMKVSDLDLILAGIEVREVSLGMHRVFNPLGFKGADFFLRLRGTFVPRSIIELISPLKNWTKSFVVVEGANIVSVSIPEETDFVVHTAKATTSIFSLSDEERIFAREFNWGFSRILAAVGKNFGVEDDIAHKILHKFISHEVSPKAHRFIESLINQEFKILLNTVESFHKKIKVERPRFHFNFPFVLTPGDPFFLNSRLRLVDFHKWLELKDFVIVSNIRQSNRRFLNSTLALLTHSYDQEHYRFLNQLLRRRAKWLIPNY